MIIKSTLMTFDLIPKNFNYKEYLKDYELNRILGEELPLSDPSVKKILPVNFSVDVDNKDPFPVEYDDLIRLHYICRNRKIATILEFGVGKSTVIFADALRINKNNYFDYSSKNLRRKELYQCHSIDNYKSWIDECRKIIPKDFINDGFVHLHIAELKTGLFNERICTYYDPIPNICPDLIYLDGPDQFSPEGEIRGISTKHPDRMPMAADILCFEHFLQPGTLLIVDGRTANARFLKCNLQRNWSYHHNEDWDQHFFELLEEPLGIYNKRMLDFNLGSNYYLRLNSLKKKKNN